MIRPPARVPLLPLLALGLLLAACGTGHSLVRIGDNEIHTFRRNHNNAHLVKHGQDAVLIDAGLAADAEALDHDIRAAGLDPRALRAILLTHGHADHAGGAGFFHQRYGTPILAGAGDRSMLARGANDPLCPTGFIARQRFAKDQRQTYPPLTATTWVEGEIPLASVAGIEGRVRPLPGHTPGSLVVLLPGAVFVGDLLRGSIVGSGAELHLYMCDVPGNQRDIRALLGSLSPGPTQFFVGHFGPVTREQVAERFR